MHIYRYFLIAVSVMLSACAAEKGYIEPAALQPVGCEKLYTYAPGNYIVDIAGGEDVIIDPAAQDFHLYCTASDARLALEKELQEGRLENGDWKIYMVEGTSDEVAVYSRKDGYMLNRMTALIDWEKE